MWTHLGSGRCLNFWGLKVSRTLIDIIRLEEYDGANVVYLLFDEVKKHD